MSQPPHTINGPRYNTLAPTFARHGLPFAPSRTVFSHAMPRIPHYARCSYLGG